MPIIRKVVSVGSSRGVTLPKSWIALVEKESGVRMTEIIMEVDAKITIEPYIRKEPEKVE
jgi:hypothetical protein